MSEYQERLVIDRIQRTNDVRQQRADEVSAATTPSGVNRLDAQLVELDRALEDRFAELVRNDPSRAERYETGEPYSQYELEDQVRKSLGGADRQVADYDRAIWEEFWKWLNGHFETDATWRVKRTAGLPREEVGKQLRRIWIAALERFVNNYFLQLASGTQAESTAFLRITGFENCDRLIYAREERFGKIWSGWPLSAYSKSVRRVIHAERSSTPMWEIQLKEATLMVRARRLY